MKQYQAPTKNTVRALVELYKARKSLTVYQLNEKVENKFTPGHLLALARREFVNVTEATSVSGDVNSYEINQQGWTFLEDHYLENIDNTEYIQEVFGIEQPYQTWTEENNILRDLFISSESNI